jgi:radical SAM superfamily enzyme YgiQ (UPF0313 family)
MQSKRFIQPANPMTVSEGIDLFPSPSRNKVQILRPFAVYSARAYSTPITVPIGPAYIAAILEKSGYKVEIIDGIGEGIQQLNRSENGAYVFQGLTTQEILDRIDPNSSILGISLMFSQDWVHHRELINAIKEKFPDLTILVGGEHPTALPEYVLRDCPSIDYLIAGEGELTFLEFLHRYLSGESSVEIPGVFFIDDEGNFVDNGPARRISDFSNLPWPAWHLCDVEKFFSGSWSHGIGYGRNLLILATRGCPYQCTFCSSPTMWTTRYLMRPVVDVVDEIEFLIKKYQVNSFDFADLTAIIKKEWILEFANEIKRRNLKFIWQLPSGTRSEALDQNTVKAIYEAGCKFLVYAPESGSEVTLDKIKKRLTLRSLVASVQEAVKVGHTIKVNLVIGFPHENRRDLLKTMLFNIRMAFLGVDDINISIFSPYPGSELFNDLQQNGTIPKIDDEYFQSLIVQFDFTFPQSVCPGVSNLEIAAIRFVGMSLFYILSYTLYPKRLWRLAKNIFGGNFQAGSLFEQRVRDSLVRTRLH